VTITLPDMPETAKLAPDELKLELACALYARGRVGKIAAAEMAGVDFFSLQRALEERGIPLYTEQMLADDLRTLKTLFPR
jgi:predicted HTH domain antitoxin